MSTPINPKIPVAKSKKKSPLVFCAMSPKKSLRDLTGQAGGSIGAEKPLVFVAMSGGVDSSVAALLLANSPKARTLKKKAGLPAGRQGYNVVGVFMRCWSSGDGPDARVGVNCEERDAEDARRVAAHIGIPFYVWDFEKEYKQRVVEYMVEGYRAGITPNPDVMCNREIKFGIFLERALKMGADFMATGHYAKVQSSKIPPSTKGFGRAGKNQNDNSKFKITYRLFEAKDKNKDQSYFLWTLTQKQLRHCLFPIGDYLKPEVRAMARKAGLPTAEKKDSQGICFLGKVSLGDFLKTYIPERTGAVLNSQGEKIGEHNGAHFYTIGQRHGIGNIKHQAGNHIHQSVYVASKDVASNVIVVASGSENKALHKKELRVADVNLISGAAREIIGKEMEIMARVRYRQPLAKATLTIADWTQTDAENLPRESAYDPRCSAMLVFEHGQKFVAPGQSAVFYSKNGNSSTGSLLTMLGGGIIL